jgi:hypothetical protein
MSHSGAITVRLISAIAGGVAGRSLSISDMQLARTISEFTSIPPNEASIATLEKRLNPQY